MTVRVSTKSRISFWFNSFEVHTNIWKQLDYIHNRYLEENPYLTEEPEEFQINESEVNACLILAQLWVISMLSFYPRPRGYVDTFYNEHPTLLGSNFNSIPVTSDNCHTVEALTEVLTQGAASVTDLDVWLRNTYRFAGGGQPGGFAKINVHAKVTTNFFGHNAAGEPYLQTYTLNEIASAYWKVVDHAYCNAVSLAHSQEQEPEPAPRPQSQWVIPSDLNAIPAIYAGTGRAVDSQAVVDYQATSETNGLRRRSSVEGENDEAKNLNLKYKECFALHKGKLVYVMEFSGGRHITIFYREYNKAKDGTPEHYSETTTARYVPEEFTFSKPIDGWINGNNKSIYHIDRKVGSFQTAFCRSNVQYTYLATPEGVTGIGNTFRYELASAVCHDVRYSFKQALSKGLLAFSTIPQFAFVQLRENRKKYTWLYDTLVIGEYSIKHDKFKLYKQFQPYTEVIEQLDYKGTVYER